MVDFLYILLGTGASLLFLALVFIPLEKAFPAKTNQKVFRSFWFVDLCYFLGQYLFWSSLVLVILNYLGSFIEHLISNSVRLSISKIPFWIQASIVIVLSNFLIYWGHRLQHHSNFLWKFHKVHHSSETLDWLAAHREHPLDSIYTIGIINLPALILGFDLNAIALLVAFRGIWAIYIHSNVRLNIGFLKKVIGSPELHHWHHDKSRDRGNYANLSPLMDILFGTYVCPSNEPNEYGIQDDFPANYVEQLVNPVVPLKIRNKFKSK